MDTVLVLDADPGLAIGRSLSAVRYGGFRAETVRILARGLPAVAPPAITRQCSSIPASTRTTPRVVEELRARTNVPDHRRVDRLRRAAVQDRFARRGCRRLCDAAVRSRGAPRARARRDAADGLGRGDPADRHGRLHDRTSPTAASSAKTAPRWRCRQSSGGWSRCWLARRRSPRDARRAPRVGVGPRSRGQDAVLARAHGEHSAEGGAEAVAAPLLRDRARSRFALRRAGKRGGVRAPHTHGLTRPRRRASRADGFFASAASVDHCWSSNRDSVCARSRP